MSDVDMSEVELQTLFRASVAFVRANLKCLLLKLTHPKNFTYSHKSRVYPRVEITLRKGGVCTLGSNLKLDSDSQITTFGGKLNIGENVGIGKRNIIGCQESVEIGEGSTLGPNVLIYDHDHKFEYGTGVKQKEYKTSPVKIGKNVWIGANNVVLRGTNIGDNCVIAAGGVLKGDYPANSIIIQKKETTMISIQDRGIEHMGVEK
ncbi:MULTISPECIES: acyltransferase [Enterococcus]|uniref:acyltransferase n=1 Tax=Enterococcus TaxID=1350 RepID=UPI0023A9DA19|nr:acyltransferase [Enterococcus faecium]MDE5173770.1 acyltransferase [Enterococcus faecium]